MKGSIEKRGENSYRLVVSQGFDGSGKRIKKTRCIKASSPKEADTALALFIADIQRGDAAQSKGMSVAELWKYWLDNHATANLEQTTLVYYSNMWPRIETAIGNTRLDKLEPKHIQAFLKNLGEPGVKHIQEKKPSDTSEEGKEVKEDKHAPCLAPITIRKYHAVLSGLFSHAVKWNLMNYNPCARVTAPKVKRSQKKALYDFDQTRSLLTALEGEELRHRLLVMLALTAGLRNEELFGLHWQDISDNLLKIKECRVYLGKEYGTVTKSTKNASSDRELTVPVEVVELLNSHKLAEKKKHLKKGVKWTEQNFVFTTWDAKPMHPQAFRCFLKRFTEANNLPHISPHDFRHMAATFLIASGTDIRTVSGKLGHSKAMTTMNTYAHLLKKAETETADTMTKILEAVRQQPQDTKKPAIN